MRRLPHPANWPLTVAVPLLVAGLMATVASGVSWIVLTRLEEDQKSYLRQLAATHLDGLAVALQPHLIRQDVWEAFDVLDRTSRRDGGIAARFAATRFALVTLPDGSVLAASDPLAFPVGAPLPAVLRPRLEPPDELVIDEPGRLAWSHRRVEAGGVPLGTVLVEMDIGGLLDVRRHALTTLVAINAGLTLTLAALGYALVRRLLRPIRVLDAYVERIRTGRVEPIPARFIAGERSEFGHLFRRFNAMAEALAEREALAARLAAEEKLALLGRLASGMAHEVNNPLGGMLMALDTLKHHGDDPGIPAQSAGLVERGLKGIGAVVRAALLAYKEAPGVIGLTPEDLDDVRHLALHDIQRRRLRLVWKNDLPGRVGVDGAAVRQMALNLLLNASRASPVGGEVRLDANVGDDGHLRLTVRDQGPGLPAEMADVLRAKGGAVLPGGQGLGLWTVARLLERTGGTVEIAAGPEGGTAITLVLPVVEDAALERRPQDAAA